MYSLFVATILNSFGKTCEWFNSLHAFIIIGVDELCVRLNIMNVSIYGDVDVS